MRFVITAQASTGRSSELRPEFDAELLKAYMRLNEEMHLAGVLLASEGLNPSGAGARIAVSGLALTQTARSELKKEVSQ